MRWRGAEIHVGRENACFLISGGPSVTMTHQNHRTEILESPNQLGPYCLSFSLAHVLKFEYVAPSLTGDQIQQALALQRQSLLPAADAAVFSGWYAPATAGERGEQRIVDVMLRRDMIDGVLDRLGLAARQCQLVFVRAGDGNALPVYWNIDGRGFAAGRRRNARSQFVVAWLSAFAMLTILVWTNFSAARARLMEVESKIAELAAEANMVAARQAEEMGRIARSRSLAREVSRNRRMGAAIEKLSVVLDDDVVLSSLTITSDGMVLEGSALAPEPLIAALATAALFSDVSFASPIVRPPGEARSRFSISSRRRLEEVQ